LDEPSYAKQEMIMKTSVVEKRVPAFSFLLLALALAFPQEGVRAQTERLQGNDVSVYNLAGRVEVVPGTGSDVTVQVNRGGNDGQRLEVEVREVDGRQALIIR